MMQPNLLEFWIDLNLPPTMAEWLKDEFKVDAKSFNELGFTLFPDVQVYKLASKRNNIIVITTKDVDFKNYQNIVGPPPRILYLNVGNISNKNLKILIQEKFSSILVLFLTTTEPLIEISTE